MISRANLNGSNPEFLIEGLTSPSGIALALQPAAIPTAGEWGLIVMMMMMIATATTTIRRRTRMTA